MEDEEVRYRVLARRLLSTGEARRLRVAAGVILAEIAEEVGVTETTVARWEGGVRQPRGPVAGRYGLVLDRLRRQVGGVKSRAAG